MTKTRPPQAGPEILEQVQALLEDPDLQGHPLHEALAQLRDYALAQDQRLERLMRISDGYHLLERNHTQSLADRCDRQLRRMHKLARISDQYQKNLWEVTESLREAANQDPLTGLANRRFLMERLKDEIQRAERKHTPLVLCLMDVDHFKRINDRFGHEVGDTALCEIAGAVRQGVRRYDVYGRWGGEEFLLVLPQTSLAEAEAVIDRVRQEVGGITVGEGESLSLSASFGYTCLHSGEDPNDILKRADIALFRAKEAGRNRVEQEV
ncbi:biofilm regulation diguanylate cyclase SiaD [Ectothiorhodospira variabilis]|uniref:biofilm regulation diguanylate cyclase SiaD n=1 Tax=Ectothiorhodospira variabilis TaxID=505694 RepID=UPI001EFAA322|nr:biofilm regulation diguanylate cyclase SiaD [Ectothiorhodospira variabilis]MCG5493283.1 biofilm regulation diguanylate cyclase SiaD [Ectothiorhodospira variabilis]MCG5502612.1 biofilm regulation diguanylate cyclase SiaD [Ectothiorhodospira variabilis]MCG5505622.1 biofilm regulation diguanylate cyclase SiaD [Ectothiorhodospira variabilis]